MTGNDDRLDEIIADVFAGRCPRDPADDLLALAEALRDARAEIERWRASQAAHADVYERLTAELAAERAKVERVKALLYEPLNHDVLRRALTGDEQGE